MPAYYASPQHSPSQSTYAAYPGYGSYQAYPAYPPHGKSIAGPSKQPYQAPASVYPYPQPSPYSRSTLAPPERAESLTTTGGTFSAGSSYAGSDTDSTGVAGIDLLDYMHDRLSSTIDPLPLDRSLATQAQT